MSSYNGLSVALRRPFSNGLLVTANYMWSHGIDNGSNGERRWRMRFPRRNPVVPGLRIVPAARGTPPL